MSALNEPIAKRIATLFRMLGSNFDGEVLGAVAAMKRLFKAEGLTFHDIATVIENCNGEIEERKYSDADAEIIFSVVSKRAALKRRASVKRRRNSMTPMASRAGTRSRCSARKTALSCATNGSEILLNDMAGKIIKYGAANEKADSASAGNLCETRRIL